jgi:hypothetical protein
VETGTLSKAEKVAWLQLGLLLVASACLGWLWWSSWPDGDVLKSQAGVFDGWPVWIMVVFYVGVEKIKRRGPSEPMEDERDRAINGAARTSGFAALGLMVAVLASIARLDGWRSQVTPEWLSLALVSMLVLALLLDAGHRLVRYRGG